MGHLVEGLMEKRDKNNTFGGFGFDVCNPNSCLGGDTLTVNIIIDTRQNQITALALKWFSKSFRVFCICTHKRPGNWNKRSFGKQEVLSEQ